MNPVNNTETSSHQVLKPLTVAQCKELARKFYANEKTADMAFEDDLLLIREVEKAHNIK
jgi:hypothetical protein